MLRVSVTVLALVLSVAVAAADPDSGGSLLGFGLDPHQSDASLQERWMKVPAEVREKVSQFLFVHMGLSSTGAIRLIGIYAGRGKDQQMFHFQELDLFGTRLFWSVLISPDM